MTDQTMWDRLWQVGQQVTRQVGAALSSQDQALRNARVATTALSRARVERDAVEIFLEEHLAELAEVEDAAGDVEDLDPAATGDVATSEPDGSRGRLPRQRSTRDASGVPTGPRRARP